MTQILYELAIHGVIGEAVLIDLEGFEVVSVRNGETTLRGWVVDQSFLMGILDRVARFGLELTSVAPVTR